MRFKKYIIGLSILSLCLSTLNLKVDAKSSEKKTNAKALVLLVDFLNYKYNDFNKKEKSYSDLKFNNYDKGHYEDMLFKDGYFKGKNNENLITMKEYYKEQSGNSYIFKGDVYGWYTTKKDISYYGESTVKEGGYLEHDANVEELIKEAVESFEEDAKKKNIDLSKYDIEKKDEQGNVIAGSDGVIDHLIIVHAGLDEAVGGGSVGSSAVWAHRGTLDKEYSIKANGKDLKVRDYTIQAQDAGVGTFAHEYGHDLGLIDEYDTLNTGKDNPVEYWSIMAKGCYAGKIAETEPVGFSPWDKKYLQDKFGGKWLNYHEYSIKDINEKGFEEVINEASNGIGLKSSVIINLDKKNRKIVNPVSGNYVYYSGNKNNFKSSMKTKVDLRSVKNSSLNFNTFYDIEEGWDVASVKVREIGEDKWESVKGNITTSKYKKDCLFKLNYGITGKSKEWIKANFNLDKYTGKVVELSINYETDPATLSPSEGIYIDNLKIDGDGKNILSDDCESDSKFILNGFIKSTGEKNSKQYYMLEWRTHNGVDKGLLNLPNQIVYNKGLLIWYCDDYYDNNWIRLHPGEGFQGVVDGDSLPVVKNFLNNGEFREYANSDYQLHDATFSLEDDKEIKIKDKMFNSEIVDNNVSYNPEFNDSNIYFNEKLNNGFKAPKFGLNIKLLKEDNNGKTIKLNIRRYKEYTVEEGLKVENISDVKYLNLNKDSQLNLKLTNNYKQDKNIEVILGYFDKNNKMISMSKSNQNIKSKGNTNLKLDLNKNIKNVHKVRVFFWDSIEDMNNLKDGYVEFKVAGDKNECK